MDHREYNIYVLANLQFLLKNIKNRKHRKILKHYVAIVEKHPIDEPLNQPLIAQYILQGMMILHKTKR